LFPQPLQLVLPQAILHNPFRDFLSEVTFQRLVRAVERREFLVRHTGGTPKFTRGSSDLTATERQALLGPPELTTMICSDSGCVWSTPPLAPPVAVTELSAA
jgi:hypothetical protein